MNSPAVHLPEQLMFTGEVEQTWLQSLWVAGCTAQTDCEAMRRILTEVYESCYGEGFVSNIHPISLHHWQVPKQRQLELINIHHQYFAIGQSTRTSA